MAGLAAKGDVMESSADRCLICLSDYERGEEVRLLSCKHGFHKECVDQWLSKGANSCPACRTEAVNLSRLGNSSGSSSDVAEVIAGFPPGTFPPDSLVPALESP